MHLLTFITIVGICVSKCPDSDIVPEQEIVIETLIIHEVSAPESVHEVSAPESVPPTVEVKYNEEIVYLSKTVWGEARGCSKTEQAAVVWCVLNRVDSALPYMPDAIVDVITQEGQFVGYRESNPVTEDIKSLVIDVLTRWENEKSGENDVGRVLPSNYLYFTGDGKTNTFRTEYIRGEMWNWTLHSPYQEDK